MASLAALLYPILLLATAPSAVTYGDGTDGYGVIGQGPLLNPEAAQRPQPSATEGVESESQVPWWVRFAQDMRHPSAQQVRIERRIILRISPRATTDRRNLDAVAAQQVAPQRFVSRAMGDCIPVGSIAAVQASGANRLLLYLRDRRLVSAQLERTCSARDYYSGFYFERNEDGQLCVDRDKLLSRTGAKCSLSGMAQLVPAVAED